MPVDVLPRDGAIAKRIGRVVRSDSQNKATGGQLELEVTVDNRDRALPVGAVVDAALTLARQEQVLTVPRSAIQSVTGKQYVFQMLNGRALRQAVAVDDVATDPVAIRSGLKAGDQVISERLNELTDGARVRPAVNRN